MAEAAGLVLGVLGVAGLFKSCIDNFDIVVKARSFSHDFEVICAELGLHRLRLVCWGESLGFPDGPFHPALNNHDICTAIQHALNALFTLLADADGLTRRYELDDKNEDSMPTSKGMIIFRDSFERFKDRIRRNQKQKSTMNVIRWSVHDLAKFESTVTKVRSLMEALEKTTDAVRHAMPPETRLVAEIESITDPESLSLLQEVGSSHHAPRSLRAISDGASARLTRISSTNTQSFYTALNSNSNHEVPTISSDFVSALSEPLASVSLFAPSNLESIQEVDEAEEQMSEQSEFISTIPQQQRWMAELMQNHTTEPRPLGPPTSSQEYGRELDQVKTHRFNSNASEEIRTNWPIYRRLYHEVRIIRDHQKTLPFIHVDTVENACDRAIASIEGPPGTPYEGGVFWITVRLMDNRPPLLRFHTRIYHPNIDHTGKLCADYEQSWKAKGDGTRVALDGIIVALDGMYFHHYSLAALLFAVCGLLSRPNVEDPLVPEIGAIYITDYDSYCEAARLYTKTYAHTPRPRDQDLVFVSETDFDSIETPPRALPIPSRGKGTSTRAQLSSRSIVSADWGELDRLIASQTSASLSRDTFDSQGPGLHVPQYLESEMMFMDLSWKYKNVKRLFWEGKAQIERIGLELNSLLEAGWNETLSKTRKLRRMADIMFDAVDSLALCVARMFKNSQARLHEYWPDGRAIVTEALIDGVFKECFHPNLDIHLSQQLKRLESNLSQSPASTNSHDVASWRCVTLEAMMHVITTPEACNNRYSFQHVATRNVMKRILYLLNVRDLGSESVSLVSQVVGYAIDIAAEIADLSLRRCHIRIICPREGDHAQLDRTAVRGCHCSACRDWVPPKIRKDPQGNTTRHRCERTIRSTEKLGFLADSLADVEWTIVRASALSY